jgi:Ras-related protein Rab-1A
MMVYDITDLESFQNLGSWLIEIEKNASKNVYKILVGNKSDLEKDRKVTFEQGKEFANQYGMKFFETSAKESTNVQEAFVTMTKEIIKETSEKKINMEQNKNIKVDNMKNAASINTGNCNC